MDFMHALFAGDVNKIRTFLDANPEFANKPVSMPENVASAHPLHRICDAVFLGGYPQSTAIEIANMFLEHGAQVNPEVRENQDSPLTAACSLRCDELALFYIDKGANIRHRGCHGGTALHWAAWCGRDRVLKKLLSMNPDLNLLCTDFKSTPLFWAIHGHKFGGADNRHHQAECAELLLSHGADRSIPNFEGYLPAELLDKNDLKLKKVFQNQ
jgi:hypothetical protein